MAIEVIRPGMLTTVQDPGRTGYAADGYPECGACDKETYTITNIIAGNQGNEPALECTFMGPVLRFTEPAIVCVCRAKPRIDGIPVQAGVPILLRTGSTLDVTQLCGVRAYIAVYGGIRTEPVLGSCSTDLRTHIGGTMGRACIAGNLLPTVSCNSARIYRKLIKRMHGSISFSMPSELTVIHVIPGPQDDLFNEEEQNRFYGNIYSVGMDSNRMGIRLNGEPITQGRGTDILSDAIVEGSIQISANGLPIIMLADHQTTGGYAKIATVIPTDIPLLAQMMPGRKICFERIDIETAVLLYRKKIEEWNNLKERMAIDHAEDRPEFGSGRKLRSVYNRKRRGDNRIRYFR